MSEGKYQYMEWLGNQGGQPEFYNGLGWVDDPEYNDWSDKLSAENQQQQDEQQEQEDEHT